MHPSSYDKMAEFRREYLTSRRDEELTIIDLGSCDYNGSYRAIFSHARWRYLGVDLTPGKNVDLVLRDPYYWRELKSESADVLISGQTFEHTEFFWETILEIARVLKPNGLCCLIAPAAGPEHRYPLDCWRIYADGFRALARHAGLEVLHARTQWGDLPGYDSESNKWHESILIARKPRESAGPDFDAGACGRPCNAGCSRFRQRSRHWCRFFTPRKASTGRRIWWSRVSSNSAGLMLSSGCQPGRGPHPCGLISWERSAWSRFPNSESTSRGKEHFAATTARDFESIRVEGEAERLPDETLLRLQIPAPIRSSTSPSRDWGGRRSAHGRNAAAGTPSDLKLGGKGQLGNDVPQSPSHLTKYLRSQIAEIRTRLLVLSAIRQESSRAKSRDPVAPP